MVLTEAAGNPFRPGIGSPPPILAGRDAELDIAGKLLDGLSGGAVTSQGILLYGPRGTGKTALLDRIAGEAVQRGVQTGELSPDALTDRDALVAEVREQAGLNLSRLTGVQVGGIGATAERAPLTRNLSSMLAGWLEAAPFGLALLMDEVHTVDPSVGRGLFGALHSVARKSMPLLVVAAGTPDAPRRLRRSGTYMERAFVRFRIGRLGASAARRALSAPAAAAGRRMSEGVADMLASEAQCYPYFIQLVGSAAWKAAERLGPADTLSATAARAGIEDARPIIEDFYGDRWIEAEEHGLDDVLPAVASLFREEGPRVDGATVRELLKGLTDTGGQRSWSDLRASLMDQGILWETAPGAWEMGIPSFADHVLARSESGLRKKP